MKKHIILFLLIEISIFIQISGQSKFDMATSFQVANYNPNPDFALLKAYDNETISKAFTYISKQSNTQFNYPQGGCPERAILIHYLLDSLKINNFRVWIFAPSRTIEGSSEKIFILDKNNLTTDSENKISWDFHVAPCILKKRSDQKIDTVVIDPSINSDKPLLLNEWFSSIGNREKATYCFLDGKYYQFNRQNNGNSNVIDGFFFPYEQLSFEQHWVEKMMALNDVAYYLFTNYIKGKNSNLQEVKDVKAVVGNSATLKEVLSFNDGLPNSSKLQYLTTNYPQFASTMWTYYLSRLVFWIERMKKLR